MVKLPPGCAAMCLPVPQLRRGNRRRRDSALRRARGERQAIVPGAGDEPLQSALQARARLRGGAATRSSPVPYWPVTKRCSPEDAVGLGHPAAIEAEVNERVSHRLHGT